jgi:hypothetical protein
VQAARLPPSQYRELAAQDQDLRGLHASSRRDSRSHMATRVMRRQANRKHVTAIITDGRRTGNFCRSEP